MKKIEVTKNIYYVGIHDKNLKVFDIVMETQYGTSYNSYIIKGKEKTVLVETVKTAFFDEFIQNIKNVCDPKDIDYIVVNHTEPDHSGSLEKMLDYSPNATVVGSRGAITFLQDIINKPFPNRIVSGKDTIDIGGMSMQFFLLPMLHWPDTMFTYIKEEKTLFTCDCFGCHYADDRIFNDKMSGDFIEAYKYYFDGIISPYAVPFMLNAIKTIEPLDIEIIATGHGPVLRENIQSYIDMYRNWCNKKTIEKKSATIIYVSAYGYTKSLAEAISKGLQSEGIKTYLFDLVTDSKEQAIKSINSTSSFLLGSPTMLGDALSPIWEVLVHINPTIHKGKTAGAFGSFAWSGEAVPNLMARMKQLKLNLPLEGIKIKLKPTEEDLKNAENFGEEFAKFIK